MKGKRLLASRKGLVKADGQDDKLLDAYRISGSHEVAGDLPCVTRGLSCRKQLLKDIISWKCKLVLVANPVSPRWSGCHRSRGGGGREFVSRGRLSFRKTQPRRCAGTNHPACAYARCPFGCYG